MTRGLLPCAMPSVHEAGGIVFIDDHPHAPHDAALVAAYIRRERLLQGDDPTRADVVPLFGGGVALVYPGGGERTVPASLREATADAIAVAAVGALAGDEGRMHA